MWQDTPVPPTHSRRTPVWFWWLLSLGLLILTAFLLLPSLQPRHDSSRRSYCVHDLKQIGLALQIYHDAHGSFPPAVINDEHGVPMHSWRAILLPYFEGDEVRKLAEQYRFDEPWNGPNNRQLVDKMPKVYHCRGDDENDNQTSYLAVVGSETMWRESEPMRIREMTDGTPNTIAVVECSDSGINWLEPRDLTFPDAAAGINALTDRPGIRSEHSGGAMVLFADGSVHFLPDGIKPDILRGLLTPAGGENAEIPE